MKSERRYQMGVVRKGKCVQHRAVQCWYQNRRACTFEAWVGGGWRNSAHWTHRDAWHRTCLADRLARELARRWPRLRVCVMLLRGPWTLEVTLLRGKKRLMETAVRMDRGHRQRIIQWASSLDK